MFSLAIEKQVTIDELQMLDYLFLSAVLASPTIFILRAMMSSSKNNNHPLE